MQRSVFFLTFTRVLAVMLPAGLVVADDTHDVLPVLVLDHSAPGLAGVQASAVRARHGRGRGGGSAVDLSLHPSLRPGLWGPPDTRGRHHQSHNEARLTALSPASLFYSSHPL